MKKVFTWKKFFESRLFFVVGIAVLAVFSVSLTRAQLKDRAILQEIDDLQSETDTLIQERQNYETLLGFLQSPVFLEKEARSSLGYAKPGETVVVIEKNAECRTPHQNKFGAGPVQNDTCMEEDFSLKKMSNPRKWWIYFFGKI